MIPDEVVGWVKANGFGEVAASQFVGGGCINNGAILRTDSGKTFFLKQNPHAPADMFSREAEGLQALHIEGGPRVPEPYLVGNDFLLLENLSPHPKSHTYWSEFGHQLAFLHSHQRSKFGFDHDNYIGSTPQPNPWTEDGYEFFKGQRLSYQAQLAHRNGLLDASDFQRVEALSVRLETLIPEQPASLIHGDLWSGNAISDSRGDPAIIDPAAHFGWAEAELGMTALFGGFPETFYAAYVESNPLQPGWRGRLPIYNLYHLLNHVNLFGSGYLGQARSILDRFS